MKIPSPIRRGAAWRIQFMFCGERYSATFDTPIECKDWAARKIVQLKDDQKRIDAGGLPQHTLSELLTIYRDKVSIHKKGGQVERLRINAFMRNNPQLSATHLEQITPQMLTAWRNQRMAEVSESTARRDLNTISSAFTYAVKDLYWLKENPFLRVRRPKSAKPRHRRVTPDDVDRVLAELEYERGSVPTNVRHFTAWCFLFAIGTGMRTSEILRLTWQDVYPRYVRLHDAKNGYGRDVPLSKDMRDLIELVRGISGDVVIPISRDSVKNVFSRATKRAGIEGLIFKDSRHEAATNLSKKMDAMSLAKTTGHRDLKTLLNVYYNPTGDDLADLLD